MISVKNNKIIGLVDSCSDCDVSMGGGFVSRPKRQAPEIWKQLVRWETGVNLVRLDSLSIKVELKPAPKIRQGYADSFVERSF